MIDVSTAGFSIKLKPVPGAPGHTCGLFLTSNDESICVWDPVSDVNYRESIRTSIEDWGERHNIAPVVRACLYEDAIGQVRFILEVTK